MSNNPGHQILSFLSQQPDKSAKPSEIMAGADLGLWKTSMTLAQLERQGLVRKGEDGIYVLTAEWEPDPGIPPEVIASAEAAAQLTAAFQTAGYSREEAMQLTIAAMRANNHTTTTLA